jgi:hypothetical protein
LLDKFILHRVERSAVLSIQFKLPNFHRHQRHYRDGGSTIRLAVVGQANVQVLKLCSLLKRKANKYAPTHSVESVVREK